MYQPWQSILLVIAHHATNWAYYYLKDEIDSMPGGSMPYPEYDPKAVYQYLYQGAISHADGPYAYAVKLAACATLDPHPPAQVLSRSHYQAAAISIIPMNQSFVNIAGGTGTYAGVAGDPWEEYNRQQQQQDQQKKDGTGSGSSDAEKQRGGFWDGVTFNTVADFLEEAGRIITGARSGGASPGTSGPMPAQEPPKKNGNLVFIIGGVVLVGLFIALVIKSRS